MITKIFVITALSCDIRLDLRSHARTWHAGARPRTTAFAARCGRGRSGEQAPSARAYPPSAGVLEACGYAADREEDQVLQVLAVGGVGVVGAERGQGVEL